MLNSIVTSKNDGDFARIVSLIKDTYFSEKEYLAHKDMLPGWEDPPDDDVVIKKIEEDLHKITQDVCNQAGTCSVVVPPKKKSTKYVLPFVDRFHKLFLQRYYNEPIRDPRKKADELVRIARKGTGNYSKNEGNYNHFVNVVMATARLVSYFGDRNNVKWLLSNMGGRRAAQIDDLPGTLLYKDAATRHNQRAFKLMLAAFYHDLGKTVLDRRHAMEGALIMAEDTTVSSYRLGDICKCYGWKWTRDDLFELSNFLKYHDSFGTLGTGESSYLLLIEILDRLKRCSLKYSTNAQEQIECSYRALFDLWLLNVADIMTSGLVSNKQNMKWRDQGEVWKVSTYSKYAIKAFLKSEVGARRIHDFGVAMRLLEKHNEVVHPDDTSQLAEMAQEETLSHTTERIRRLICESLKNALVATLNESDHPKIRELISTIIEIDSTERVAFTYKFKIQQNVILDIIFRCIQSLSNPGEFSKKFSYIETMDYALGFFEKIIRRALMKIEDELNSGSPTGWIRPMNAEPDLSGAGSEFLETANAQFIVDNYSSIVVKTLERLLLREHSIKEHRKIEFEDAGKRLTNEKIDRIIGLRGPYQQDQFIELILKTVFTFH